jgi:hypothetical protein
LHRTDQEYIPSEPNIPEEWYKACKEDIVVDLDADVLHGRDVSIDEENRREQVKHTLIELFNAAPFQSYLQINFYKHLFS